MRSELRILKEPRNAIVRQYQKLLAMDEVQLILGMQKLRSFFLLYGGKRKIIRPPFQAK